MTKNEIKAFLKDKNITEKELDEMWSYCASFPEFGGKIVTQLYSSGLTWRDLNVFAASGLLDLFKSIEEKVFNSLICEENEEECG